MLHYTLRQTAEFGRGLYAASDLQAGVRLCIGELLILNPDDTKKINETALKCYVFEYNEDQTCVVLGDGAIFNHSDSANVNYEMIRYDGRPVLEFSTRCPVQKGEQLFIHYHDDGCKIDIDVFKAQASLIVTPSDNCC